MPDLALHAERRVQPVYLDYAATMPVDPRVARRMLPYMTQWFGNPASRSHTYGWAADEAVEPAREQVASLVNADPREIVWTSGATEPDNPALKGAAHCAPHYLNVSFRYVEGESLLRGMRDVAVSSGSACTSASLEPGHVLRAMGRDDELAHSSIRFTLGRFTTAAEIGIAIAQVTQVVDRLRAMSPLRDMAQAGVDAASIR